MGNPFPSSTTARRIWRHLDRYAFQSFLHARRPRGECPQHGKLQDRVPWVDPNSRFTALFQRWSLRGMPQTDTAAAAYLLGICWDMAWGIQERTVARGLATKPPLLLRQRGVDEKVVGLHMGDPYFASILEHVSSAAEKRVFDRFPISKHANEGAD